jgi:NAD(P)-dependent dehydrogenase (short-subunit alcohol dehydrogenase family)
VIDDLRAKVAVVTGGGSGIGRATALALAREGAHVVVADIDGARADEVAAEASGLGPEALGVRTDVGRDDDMQALRDETIARFAHVDVVMNNVGVLAIGDPPSIPLSAWERTINLNLMSVARSLQVFLPDLLGQASGHIVNTASTAGLWGYAYDHLAYSATKGAVVALSEALVLYTRPRGVGVTCLCPGPVSTNIAEQVQVFGELGPMQPPPLSVVEPEVVGAQVVAAIKDDTFFLPTHAEVHAILVQKAQDPERFISDQVAQLGAAS